MVPTTFSLHTSFSNSWISLFPRKVTEETAFAKLRKLFAANFGRLNLVGNISTAICHGFDKFSDGEMGEDISGDVRKDGFYFLHSMESRGIHADFNTYLWLLKGCRNSGSLTHAEQLHGKILKLGFDREPSLCNELIDIYSGFGDLDDAIEVLATFSQRNVYSWNSIISGALVRKSNHRVLSLFLQMLADNVNPNGGTFTKVLRACVGANVAFHCIEQIHARIIRAGFSTDPVVCNPLIDLFSKKGFVDSAQFIFEELCTQSSISWVAMISGFAQNSREEEALLFFCQMRKSGIKPTPYVFSSVLSACTKIELFKLGEQLHAQVFKLGFSSETFVCNALITLYCRCINLIAADQIFTDMNRRDGITYNSLISGLAQQGKSDKAFQLFDKMQLTSLKPDCVTIASLLSVCASAGAFDKGKQLHSYSIKAGITSDIIIEGSLLDLYVKCSDIATAHEFFSITAKENVVLWNVMLVAYGQLGHLKESVEMFSQMQVAGMKPNQYTYPSILRTCTSLGALDCGEQIHAHVIKTGFEHNVYVCSVLIDMYAKNKKLVVAREILEDLVEDDVVSWTAMIAGYAQHEFYVDAIRLFEEMQIRGIQSDNIGLSSALSACAGIQALKLGQQIHAQSCIYGYSMDLSIGNALVSLYARCGRLQEAYSAFETIDVKDEISWNGLISGFAQSGHCDDALQVFVRMNQAGLEANLFTFGSTVSAAANIADIKPGQQIHARMIKTGFDSEVEAGNVLITLYSKCGIIDDARKEFSQMLERNEVSWNAMITGYSQHGCGSEALDLFEQMKQQGFSPNHVTFVGVLSACSHVGLVRQGLNYFKSMNDEHGIVPRPEHYACVADILGRAGMLDHARDFIKDMPVEPDAMIWRTLLSACAVRKNIEVGEFAAQHLLELEPQDSATYVLLSNIYAAARKWDRRDQMRQMMKERGVKKEPGRSWIEAENSIHSFFVGDRLHPLADEIYDFLEELNKRLAEIGYVQDLCSILHDMEQGNKDPTAYIHSEKLAVSFGLISLPPAIPIRVIKNLRVCNDCHNWMKFASKVSNRMVVVRDAYRFHHFEGGICSCRDYW